MSSAVNKGMKFGGIGELASGLFKTVLRVYSFLNQSQYWCLHRNPCIFHGYSVVFRYFGKSFDH